MSEIYPLFMFLGIACTVFQVWKRRESRRQAAIEVARHRALPRQRVFFLLPDNPTVYALIEMYANNHGDNEGSMRAAVTALSLAPKNPGAYNNLAVEFFGKGEPRRAIELLTQAINLDPKHPHKTVLANMGHAFFMLGNYDAAVDWLQKAVDKDAMFPIAYAYLAMAYALKGDEANARAATANLRRVDPSFKLLTVEKPDSSQPAAFKDWYKAKLIPASRKARLPE